MLSYPAAISLSTRTLNRLADLLRAQRDRCRCRWRRPDAGRQASLVLAHLRNGDTYARLAAGFAIGTATAWRYVREAIDLLAVLADDLSAACMRAARLAYAILEGTLIPIDRIADQRPYYSGKHKRHSVNRSHARIRGIGERAMATLKDGKILTKLRSCPRRATAIMQAILLLHHIETDVHPR